MHVVFDARSVTDHYPGIGRYGSGLTRALARRDDVRLTLLVGPDQAGTFHSLPDVERITVPSRLTRLAQQWAVPAALRRLGPNIYHSPYYLMPYRVPCAAVVTFHDMIPLVVSGTHSMPFRVGYRLAHHLATAAADRIITVSEATASDLARLGLLSEKVAVVASGVGPEYHPYTPPEIEAVRSRHGLPEAFALYVGTNKPHKNLARLVEAWSRIGSPSTLVVAGLEDPRYAGALALATEFGARVVAAGGVREADLPVLYAAASFFVFPSLYEGFGLPVLEAMACGTPVICSNKSSLPEVAGDAAVLVDPLDVDELAQAVDRMWQDRSLRERLRVKGLARAAQFTWDRTAEATRAVYDRCIVEAS